MTGFNYFMLAMSVYTIGNGLLHDIFVLRKYKSGYDRDLLRLLMDGHILITCGLIYLIGWYATKHQPMLANYLCLLSSISLLVYCLMIFPFLKSLVTIFLNAIMLVLVILRFIDPEILG
jgi:hypothetical protein